MARRGERVQWLIDQVVVHGVPHEVIEKRTEARERLWERRWERSYESVENVLDAIARIQTDKIRVWWCKPTEVGGKLDRRKKVDIQVKLAVVGVDGPQFVNVQVKSNPDDVREFLGRLEDFLEEEGETLEERAWNKLARKRLVLLNGQGGLEEIQRNFISQLERIQEVRWGGKFDLF